MKAALQSVGFTVMEYENLNQSQMKKAIDDFGYEIKGSLLACNLDKNYKPMVTENKDIMQKAYNLGNHLLG